MNLGFTSCINFWRTSLKIYAFPSDKALFVVADLNCYIERTSIWREKNQVSQLLVSFIRPHNAVAKFTVAGPPIHMHARFSVLSSSDILKRESWSNKTTWQKFYNKPIVTFKEKFQKAALNQEPFEQRRMGVWAPLLCCHDIG